MSIPYVSLPNDSLNNPVDKPSSSKKNGPLPNGSLNNFKDIEPSTSKVINVLNNKKEKTSIPSSYAVIAMVDPGFQDPLLSERTVVLSNSKITKEEKSQVSNPVSHSVIANSQNSLLSEEVAASPNEITLEKKENPFSEVPLNEDKRSQGIFKQIFCCIK
ncbi:MAG: hypothetical protein ACRCU0_06155 [Candidatus Rhabdochlamydia sp.]